MSEHFAVLVVVVPLLTAPCCVLTRNPNIAYTLTLVAVTSVFLMSTSMLGHVLAHGPVSYAVGAWEPPWGIEYRIDALNGLVLAFVSGVFLLGTIYAKSSVEDEVPESRVYLFYAALLLFFTGLVGVTATGDAFNLFVFIEISSLSTYALISLGRKRAALYSAYRYLIAGTLGATFYLVGVGLLMQLTGTLNMADLNVRLADSAVDRTAICAFAFLAVGISLKLALFPLHAWLPGAYCNAPSAVSAIMAATATKVFVYVLIRLVFTVLGVEFSVDTMHLDDFVVPLAVVGIVVGSLAAVQQSDLKRLLAYSSIAQVGYMVLGLGLVSAAGLVAATMHMFNHALMKGALFFAAGCIVFAAGGSSFERLSGLGKTLPWTMAAVVVAGLSLVGVPATAGFISKWYLLVALLDAELWPVAVIVVLTSLLAAWYVWRIIEAAYFREPSPEVALRPLPLSMRVSLWLMALANIYFGLWPTAPYSAASTAASQLLGTG